MKKKLCRMLALTAAASLVTLGSAFAAPTLTLEEYLGQVSETSPGLKGASIAALGYGLLSESASVLTNPYFFGSFTRFDDRQETPNPAFQGDRTEGTQYTVGLSMNSRIGLNAKYSFNVAQTELHNATMIPLTNYYTSFNKLEFTQSLLRNGFGSEVRAQTGLIEASNLAQSFGNRYSALAQLVQAENAYWRLAFARKAVQVQKDVLSRAREVLNWAKRRVSLQLGDKADRLQAQASYDLRRIELMAAEEEEKNAARAFNNLRRIEGETVNTGLAIPALDTTLKLAGPEREGTRFDVVAAGHEQAAAIAQAQLDKERVKPSVDLFGNVAWTGRDPARGEAVGEAFGSSRSNVAFGVNVSVPLEAPAVVKSQRGGTLTQEAAGYKLEQTKLNEELEWNEVRSRLDDAKSRLSLLQSVEKVQKEKYENEQQRLLRGRTTTYQALTFEQDYAATQLSTLRTQNEVLQLLARMKLFQGAK